MILKMRPMISRFQVAVGMEGSLIQMGRAIQR